MSEPFLGEIKMVGFNFAPRGYATCDGQLMAISQFSALFSLLGTIYGGDGRTTFALPDLRGRFPTHHGTGPGLSTRQMGQRGGREDVTLNVTNMPSHNHSASGTIKGSSATGNSADPTDNVPASGGRGTNIYSSGPDVNMLANGVEVTVNNNGGNQPFNIMPPFLVINFVIATMGIFPSRN